jgi:hypothetical protein
MIWAVMGLAERVRVVDLRQAVQYHYLLFLCVQLRAQMRALEWLARLLAEW